MPTADLTISMDDGTTTVAPGAATSYTIVVSNNGPDAVTGATVFDSLPDGITGNSWLATGSTGGGSVTGPAIGSGPLATTVDLPVGGAVVFTFTVLVNPSLTTGSLINLAVVLAPAGTTDPNDPGNNHAIDTDTLTPQADLSVTMTDGKAIVVPGTSDTYTITVTNNGPSTVSSLTLSDTIPAALLNRNFAPSVGAYDAATGAWSGLSLASGQHVTLTLTGTIASNATGTITNTVTVAPPVGTTDTDPFNGTATDTDTLPPKLTTAASPDVTLSGSVVTLRDSATLSDGSNPTGTITFTLIAPGGLTVDTETVAVNGDGTYTTPTGFTLPTAGTVAGTYSWNATYSGDPNNNPANASPEPTVVSRASPGLSTTASPGGVAGTTLTDIAHLSGGYFPSGTITFMLTATSGLTVDTETVTANGNGTYATPTGFTLPTGTVPGTYVWHVLYNGDGNNNTVAANLENVTVGVNPFPPPGTTADMILRASNTSLIAGQYEIYDIGNNAILAASVLGQVGTDFQFAGLGSFFGSDTTDMLLRSATTGAFEVYDISNNNITNAAALGTVGLNFQVAGFGDFNRDGATDMVLRSSTTGQFELYNIRNNAITSASNLGTVGLNFQVAGFGNFNGDGSTDMMLRNVNTGQFELYDIVNNQITSAFNIGTVGLDFQVAGFADFNGDGSTDMMLRNRNTGQFELYDIVNNQITSAFNIGTVGLDFQVAGFGAFHAPGASDMILRNANTGQFEVYDIVNNQITTANSLGAVGLNFQVGGFAANPATASTGGAGSTAQLVQAMAAFGGGDGAADGLNIAPLGADNNDYTVTVTNNGPDTVTQFNLNFAPGAGLTWAGTINPVAFGSVGTLDPVGDVNSWLWSGLSLASGQSAFATFIYSIDPNATGPLTVTSTVIAPAGTTDPTPINDSFTDSDTVTPQSDLAVAIDDGTTIVVPGTSNTYTITVTNNGPSTVSSLTLTDSIPAALLNPNFTPSAGAYISTQVGPNTYTGVWSGLSLASGQSVTLTLTGTIDPNATGLLTNIVTVAPPAGTTDTNSANDTATDTDTIPVATTLATTASPNVTLSNSSVTLSDSATLTGGSNPTGNIVFTLSGPGGFSFTETDTVNGDGTYDASLTLPTTGTVVGTYSWTAIYTPGDANNLGSSAPTEQTVVSPVTPSLASAASPSGAFAGSTLTDVATLTGGYFPTGSIVFTLTGPNGFSFTQTDAVSSGNGTYSAATTLDPSGTIPGTYLWTAQYLPGDGNNNAVVAAQIVTVGGPQADLAVTVDDGKTTVTPGSSNTYTITVTNNGPSMVDALVTDSFPADFTNVSWFVLLNPGAISASPPGSFGDINATAELLPGGSVTFRASGQISASATGSLINTVTVAPLAGTIDPNPANDTATDTDTLVLPTDLAVTITNAATTLVPGISTTYAITVTNNGPNTVGSLILTDTIPGDLLNATFGSPSAGSYDRGSGLWSGLNLASGQSVSIALSGVIGIDTGTLTNTVTVSLPAGLTDTNPVNNVATDTDTLVLFGSPYPPAPAATSADMLLRRGDGLYAIYNLGNNASLAAHPLAQVGSEWQFAGLGRFQAGDTADMLLRNANTGGFQVYDINNNNITNTAFLGTVGIDWQAIGFGNFSSRGETDMILRNSNTGGLQVYDITNNQLTGSAFLGAVGLDWQFSGVGNFSGVAGETDLLLRNVNTGGLQVYDIINNQLTGSAFLGAVGLDWQFAGVAPVRGAGTSDLVLRNVNTGTFEAYNIANNQITGAASLGPVGLEWQVGGFATDPAPASTGSAGSTSQLVQAMAGFGGGGSGATDGSNPAPLNADASQQNVLTQPHA